MPRSVTAGSCGRRMFRKKSSSRVVVIFLIPTSNEIRVPMAAPLGGCNVLDLGHSNRYVPVARCCFNWEFPDDM